MRCAARTGREDTSLRKVVVDAPTYRRYVVTEVAQRGKGEAWKSTW